MFLCYCFNIHFRTIHGRIAMFDKIQNASGALQGMQYKVALEYGMYVE